jgi:putative Ca2+/H+ antiporter (TMEM165/GDT1 family)
VAGQAISKLIPPSYLQLGAACGFIAIGVLMLWQVTRGG